VDIANREKPDFIVITGDFVQNAPEPIEILCKQWLSKLTATFGVYAVLGNHDSKRPHSKPTILHHLSSVGIHVLENEVVFPIPGNALAIIGFGDYTHKHFKISPVENVLSDSSRPKLILSHHPDSAALLKKYRADLILCGHTHGGQILLPLFGSPLRYASKLISFLPRKLQKYVPYVDVLKNWDWIHGLHKLKRENLDENVGESVSSFNYLFVNRGLATHPPLRLNCDPEIAIIELIPRRI